MIKLLHLRAVLGSKQVILSLLKSAIALINYRYNCS